MPNQCHIPRSIACRCSAAILSVLQVFAGASHSALAQENDEEDDASLRTPIKHVIIIIGENRTFDHVFATYKPVHGEKVDNLLFRKIIEADGIRPAPTSPSRARILRRMTTRITTR